MSPRLVRRNTILLSAGMACLASVVALVAALSTITFVEVKGSGDALSDPVARVDRRKRIHLTRAARRWLADRGRAEFDYRFDVVAVRLGSGRPEIRHLESAFTAED